MFKFDITVHSTHSESKIVKPKTKQDVVKYKVSWRLKQLALPRHIVKKFTLPVQQSKLFSPLDKNTVFWSDHLARPPIRYLCATKRLFQNIKSAEYINTIDKAIENSWNSVYNFYRKKLKEQATKSRLSKLKKEQKNKPTQQELEKLEAQRQEHINNIAQPKKTIQPCKIPRAWKPLEYLLDNLETLSAPKQYHVTPPRELGVVSPKALEYQITEAVLKLYSIPDRLKRRYSLIELGTVKRSALRAKCTERIEKLAQPSLSAREAKKHDDDKYDPFEISKNALKYKATPRILELAKPLERE